MIAVIVLLNALGAIGFPTAKLLLAHVKPFFFAGIRLIASALFLFGYHYATTGLPVKYKRTDLLSFIKLSFLGFFLSFACSLWALQYVTAIKASFLYNLAPFLSALFSYFYFAEKMTFKKWIGLGIGFIGFAPILMANGQSHGNAGLVSWADIILLFAVVTYVYGMIITRGLMLSGSYSSTIVNATAMFWGGVFSLIASPFMDAKPLVSSFSSFDLLMFILATMSVITGYTMAGFLLKKYTATFLSFAAFTMPFFAAIYSWFLLGEQISWHFFASTAAVLVGLYIFYKEELKQGYIIKN